MGMSHAEIRNALRGHFQSIVVAKTQQMDQYGPLSGPDLMAHKSCHKVTSEAIQTNDFRLAADREEVNKIIATLALPIHEGTPEWGMVESELTRAHRDCCKTILDHNEELETYKYDVHSQTPLAASSQKEKLSSAIEEYIVEKIASGSWTKKSANSYRPQFALLQEYWSADANLEASNTMAYDVKQLLMALPKNRLKKRIEGQSLPDFKKQPLEAKDRISSQTVNKYLHTYSAFYDWAVDQGKISVNPFKRLAIKLKKSEQVRDAFTQEQLTAMVNEIKTNARGLINKDYQKWGVLIGIYTGARLNEITQLQLEDIRLVDGVWCFDINDEGDDTKRLKNTTSKRIVPIHSHLLAWGILEYVEDLKRQEKPRLFYELTFGLVNGYGRNLSYWFNQRFLKELGFKSERLVFHSFRHTIATLLTQAGVEQPLVQDIIGHAKVSTLHESYFKGYLPTQRKEALEKILQDLPLP